MNNNFPSIIYNVYLRLKISNKIINKTKDSPLSRKKKKKNPDSNTILKTFSLRFIIFKIIPRSNETILRRTIIQTITSLCTHFWKTIYHITPSSLLQILLNVPYSSISPISSQHVKEQSTIEGGSSASGRKSTLNPGDSDPRSPGAECLPGRSPRLIPVPAEQHLLERLPEHLVEDGVEDGVHHGAGVAQPGGQVEDLVVDLPLAVGAHGRDQVEDEERRPQDDEREEHDPQHFGGLLLEPDDPPVTRAVA